MADPVTWAYIGVAISAAASTTSAVAARAGEKHTREMNALGAEMQRREAGIKAEQTRTAAEQAKSDRIRRAEQDIARARVASAEGFGNLRQQMGDITYVAGLDLARLRMSEENQIAALQRGVEGVNLQEFSVGQQATMQRQAAVTGAWLNFFGTTATLGGREAQRQYNRDNTPSMPAAPINTPSSRS